MKDTTKDRAVFLEWEADSRYYERKPSSYFRAVVPPVKTKYRLDRFGLGYYGGYVTYKQMALFSILHKKHGQLIRIITNLPGLELNLVLPSDPHKQEAIIGLFKEKVPFVEQIPKNEVEKLAEF